MKYLIICILSSFFLFSCTKENPFVSEEEYDAFVEDINNRIRIPNVSFIYNNDIYFAANLEGTPEKITNTPNVVKTKLKMSFDHQKFAYLNANGLVEIIDRSGNLLDQLTQYTHVKSFDWSKDNKTLYMLNNNELVFYGEPMDVPTLTFPSIPSNYKKDFVALSISIYGDLAYIIKTDDYNFNFGYMMIMKPNDGSNTENAYHAGTYNLGFSAVLNYIQFSTNEQDLVLGYGGYGDTNFELFQNLYKNPTFTMRSTGDFSNTIYRSDLNFWLTCYQSSPTESFILMANDIESYEDNIYLPQYSGTSNSLSLDWK